MSKNIFFAGMLVISAAMALPACGRDMQALHVSPDEGDMVKDSPDLVPRGDGANETGALIDSKTQTTTTTTTTTGAVSYRWDDRVGGSAWTQYTREAIDDYGLNQEKVPSDVTAFCPKFNSLGNEQRKMFWTYLVSSITELESGFDPKNSYHEKFGKKQYSRGLMQMSYESTKGYLCPIHKESDLFIPELNLNCGVKILDHWVAKDGLIAGRSGKKWLGGSRYWAVLRFKSAIIRGWTKQLPFC